MLPDCYNFIFLLEIIVVCVDTSSTWVMQGLSSFAGLSLKTYRL